MIKLLSLLLPTVVHTLGGSKGAWPASAYAQAHATLGKLTTAEKVQLASGNNANYQKCEAKSCAYVGYITGIPRLNFTSIYLEDGPQGVADGMQSVTAFPSVMTVSQAWDPELMRRFGAAMGAEQKLKGSNVMLGPAVALVRVPWSGRNFEYSACAGAGRPRAPTHTPPCTARTHAPPTPPLPITQ